MKFIKKVKIGLNLCNYLKNSDTDKNAKVALNAMYCGNAHFR